MTVVSRPEKTGGAQLMGAVAVVAHKPPAALLGCQLATVVGAQALASSISAGTALVLVVVEVVAGMEVVERGIALAVEVKVMGKAEAVARL